MKKNKFSQIVFLVSGLWLLASVIQGCGYSTHSLISQLGYRTIYVSPFVNKIDITSETSVARRYKTYYPLLENDITSKVISRFITDGNLRLAKEEEADLILEGELTDYRRDALRYTNEDNEDVEEYRVTITVSLKLHDMLGGTMLWQAGSFSGDATYLTDVNESSAINEAVTDLSRRIVNSVTDIW